MMCCPECLLSRDLLVSHFLWGNTSIQAWQVETEKSCWRDTTQKPEGQGVFCFVVGKSVCISNEHLHWMHVDNPMVYGSICHKISSWNVLSAQDLVALHPWMVSPCKSDWHNFCMVLCRACMELKFHLKTESVCWAFCMWKAEKETHFIALGGWWSMKRAHCMSGYTPMKHSNTSIHTHTTAIQVLYCNIGGN